jgi:RNA polymerase sigma factor (TIGR02999 family)
MRRVLVDRARKRRRIKRGGEFERVDVDLENLGRIDSDDSIVRLDEALEKFTAHAPQMAELVKLRYFAGLSIADAAAEMGISPATAKRHWAFARAWLLAELRRNG